MTAAPRAPSLGRCRCCRFPHVLTGPGMRAATTVRCASRHTRRRRGHLSVWREDVCVGTVRLHPADVAALIAGLTDGLVDLAQHPADSTVVELPVSPTAHSSRPGRRGILEACGRRGSPIPVPQVSGRGEHGKSGRRATREAIAAAPAAGRPVPRPPHRSPIAGTVVLLVGLLAAVSNCTFVFRAMSPSRLDPFNSMISELEVPGQPFSEFFRWSSLLSGVAAAVFAIGLYRRIPRGRLGWRAAGARCLRRRRRRRRPDPHGLRALGQRRLLPGRARRPDELAVPGAHVVRRRRHRGAARQPVAVRPASAARRAGGWPPSRAVPASSGWSSAAASSP